MHIAVFCPFVLWPTHYATDLELVQRHLDAGDHVTVLVCDGELAACDVNVEHDPFRCRDCVRVRASGIDRLAGKVTVVPLSQFAPATPPDHLLPPGFDSSDALKAFRIEQFDIGLGVQSSLISLRRDAHVQPQDNARETAGLLRAAYDVYCWTDRFLQTHAVDTFYVFNPRFASTRGVLRACQKHGVTCVSHERGNDLRHFELYPNTFPHDRAFIGTSIQTLWDAAPPDTRQEIGAQWYREKAVGIETYEFSYVAGQTPDLLPANWDKQRRNLVIFTSSEDEFAAIGSDWDNPLYNGELAGVQTIVHSLRSMAHNLHVYVRVHPNLANVDNRQTRGLRELNDSFITVIPANSTISSYALLRAADTVLTFGSTMGIEAVYWGVPSILAGMSWYRELGVTYNPATHEELMELVMHDLLPKAVEPALQYGYYFASYGIPFQYFRATSFDNGEFAGKDIWRE